MKNLNNIFFCFGFLLTMTACELAQENVNVKLREQFKNPPIECRPIANDLENVTSENIEQKLDSLFTEQGWGGIIFSPTSATKKNFGFSMNYPTFNHVGGGLLGHHVKGQSPWVMISPPGTTPSGMTVEGYLKLLGINTDRITLDSSARLTEPAEIKTGAPGYLSKEWFDSVKKMLDHLRETGHKAVFYDEVGYPSGMANHTTPKELYRKILEKSEETITGPMKYKKDIPEEGVLMAVVAMNMDNLERIDLSAMVNDKKLLFNVPEGEWKIMIFNCRTMETSHHSNDYNAVTDFLDPDASKWFINTVYEPLYKEVGEYFGETIFQTFYDDVGIYNEEKTWTFKFNQKFEELKGKNPALYYPALWYDIGPETEAARVAFFDTRAELLAEGFPRVLTDWGEEHNLPISGHAPGNYDIQPVDMCGDPFKFYRAQPVPMVDVIFNYPYGRDGFKLVSDGGDIYDKSVISAETFPLFLPGGTKMGYRRAMELFIRGINRFTGVGMAGSMGFREKDDQETKIIGNTTDFAEWCGRTSLLMQGGRRISEIAIFYPIAALEAFYYFDAPEYTKEMRWGTFVPYESDYLAVGEMLLNRIHRDFTFIHPDNLLNDRIKVNGNSLDLINKVNYQRYKLLIIPGQRVISLKALEKIKQYFDAGGSIIATSLLPSKAAELPANAEAAIANDNKVQSIIKEMFEINPCKLMPEGITEIITNSNKGKAVFINKPDPIVLAQMIDELDLAPDVVFSDNPVPSSGGGAFSYIHKVKDELNIYFFANSTDDIVNTFVEVRGKIKPEIWDPYNGETTKIQDIEYIRNEGQIFTRFPLYLNPVGSVFMVGR